MKIIYFGKNLKYLREGLGLSQQEMLDSIGIKRTTWNGYERDNSYPKLAEFIRIAEYFDISESDLLNSDLSAGNLIEKSGNAEKRSKSNLKGNPIGNLIEETGGCQECKRKDEILKQRDMLVAALSGQIKAQEGEIAALNKALKLMEERIPEKQPLRRKAG